MLGGHPQAICLAAPLLENQRLTELFQQMLESNIMDALEHQEKQSYASLRLSLDISIKNLSKNKPEAIELFMFIGLLPGGVHQSELTKMWGGITWRSYKESLIRASLLVFRKQENILTLLPFMNARAYELLEEDGARKKTEFHFKICEFYRDYCEKCLLSVGENDFDLNEFVEKESNIWACIYRSVNRKKDTDAYDEENEDSKNVLAQSFKSATSSIFKNFTYKNKSDLSYQLNTNKSKPGPIRKTQVSAILEDENEDNVPDSALVSRQNTGNGNGHMNNECPSESNSTKILPSISNKMELLPTSKHRGNSATKYPTSQYETEEMLVIYYVATVIRLSKFSDGFKAINEYKQKKGISKITRAHIYKLLGVLTMLNEQKDYVTAKKYFNEALGCYSKINCKKGWAITRLAMLRCECEIAFNNNGSLGELAKTIEEAEKSMVQLGKIGYEVGAQRAQIYIDCLKNKSEGHVLGTFKRTLKTKTIRVKNFQKTSNKSVTKGSLLNSDVLQDEDIKLFVEVVEEEDATTQLDFKSVELKNQSKTPQVSAFKHRDFEGVREKFSGAEQRPKAKLEKPTKGLRSISSKKKLEVQKKGKRSKSRKRVKIEEPIEMGRLPSILN